MTPDDIILRTLVFFLGGFLLLTSLRNTFYSFFTRNWPQTPGKIIQSEIQKHPRKFDTGTFDVYEIHLQYEYQVAGQTYQNNAYAFDQKRLEFFENHLQKAHSIQNEYALDQKISVYYHPKKPKIAFLYPGASFVSTPLLATLGAFVGLYFCGLMTLF